MFSYRHAYHAGNHADVLKHMVLLAILQHLRQKDTPFTAIDTHAGAGWYRLASHESQVSGEAGAGVHKMLSKLAALASEKPLPAILTQYVEAVKGFSASLASPHGVGSVKSSAAQDLKFYPGSPALMQQMLRPTDSMKLFELLGTDKRLLERNMAELRAYQPELQVENENSTTTRSRTRTASMQALCEDGFEGLKRFIPPPSRRGMVLMDPSYEIKTDYRKVELAIADALSRFSTGTYMVWYPIVARPEAHALPRKLKTMATLAGKSWVQTSLSIKEAVVIKDNTSRSASVTASDKPQTRTGRMPKSGAQDKLTASGVFVINPPHTLQAQLTEGLPILAKLLGDSKPATFSVWSS